MQDADVIIKTRVKTRQLKKAQKTIEKFNKAVEKANSLADELASKKIEVEIITQSVQRQCHRKGKYFCLF